MTITIERAENGWIITVMSYIMTKEVYRVEEEMLTRVHQLMSDWNVSDKVSIIKEQP